MKPPARENKENFRDIVDEFLGASPSTEIQNLLPGPVLTALLAASQTSGYLPKISEGRAEELAELLIKTVRQVHLSKNEQVDELG